MLLLFGSYHFLCVTDEIFECYAPNSIFPISLVAFITQFCIAGVLFVVFVLEYIFYVIA